MSRGLSLTHHHCIALLIQLTILLILVNLGFSFAARIGLTTGTDSVGLPTPPKRPADIAATYCPLPSLREQDALERDWVKRRWEHIPQVLRKHGYDAWLLSMREYVEDTAFRSLVPSTTTFSARRRTLMLFTSDGEPPLYLIDNSPALWDTLNATLYKWDPKRISINEDENVAFADGLHSGERRALLASLDALYAKRTSSCRNIPVEVIAWRAGGSQLREYRRMMKNVWAMIAEGFSSRAIEVGVTTPTDLEWWFREKIRSMGVGTWFHPSVDIRRHPALASTKDSPEIAEGDMVHVDIGITAMGMNTDTQHLGYVLRRNETRPPDGLLRGLKAGNALQDMVREEMVPGRSGDEVLATVQKRMKKAGLDGDIYSHPIGEYGHSAGAVIGMTNMQNGVPHLGKMRVMEDYWTSVELAAKVYVPEWGSVERFELEEDVYWNNETRSFEWVFGQQTKFHLIRPKSKLGQLVQQAARAVGSLWL